MEDNGEVMTCPEYPYGDKMACFSYSISVGKIESTVVQTKFCNYNDTLNLI